MKIIFLIFTSFISSTSISQDTIYIYKETPDSLGRSISSYNLKFDTNNSLYSDSALNNNIEGKIYVQCISDKSCKLKLFAIKSELGYGLDEKLLERLKKLKYQYFLNGLKTDTCIQKNEFTQILIVNYKIY